MSDPIKSFGGVASGLSRGPLGIIALFIVLVYALASIVVAFGSSFSTAERLPLIYFMVSFPILVLGVFSWLVSHHANKLYPPTDFKDEKNFLESQKMQMAAVASLAIASAKKEGGSLKSNVDQVVSAVQKVTLASENRSSKSILWVDDQPINNAYTQRAFEAVGVSVTLALSTEHALKILDSEYFDVIISDMGRREGPREGYVLLDTLRQNNNDTPLIFHATSSSLEHREETRQHGGQGCTSDPGELFKMVMDIIDE